MPYFIATAIFSMNTEEIEACQPLMVPLSIPMRISQTHSTNWLMEISTTFFDVEPYIQADQGPHLIFNAIKEYC